MSWSLELHNGDLTTAGARLGTVTQGAKLVQDLRCALLEKMGTDDMHLEYGSVLDGGRRPDGQYVDSLIGSNDWDLIAMRVEAEIRRVAAAHQQAQLVRSQNDRQTYGESTLDPQELLLEVEDLSMYQAQDSLLVRITLRTGSQQALLIDVPVSNQPVITI